jgi:hypothetical protein
MSRLSPLQRSRTHFRSALILLLKEIRYTLSLLAVHPLAAPYVPAFQPLREEWTTVQATELAHQEAISVAQAKVDAADYGLDDFAGRLSKAVLTITVDVRTHPLYLHFFGDKNLTDFRRPTLGEQFRAMGAWLSSLQGSEHESLKAMAPELEKLLAAADAAVKAKAAAKQQNKQFRDVGERKQFADKLNAVRKEVHGALAKLPHLHPGLPPNFAAQFFRRETSDEDVEEQAATVESVTARIASLDEELTQEKALLDDLKRQEAEAAKAKEAVEADEAALTAAEKELAETAQKIETLKAKLGKR